MDISAKALIMTGIIFDLVNNQTLQARNSCIGVETATFCASGLFGLTRSTVTHHGDWFYDQGIGQFRFIVSEELVTRSKHWWFLRLDKHHAAKRDSLVGKLVVVSGEPVAEWARIVYTGRKTNQSSLRAVRRWYAYRTQRSRIQRWISRGPDISSRK
jgi:hypothetical protein